MIYGDFKDLARRTVSDKVLRDKAFNIAKNTKYDGYQRELASMVCNFFDKKSKGGGVNIEWKHKEQLAEEIHKPIIRNFKRRTVYSRYISGGDLVCMQLISNLIKYLDFYCALLIFLVNMLGSLLQKRKKVLVLLVLFKIS